MAGSISNSLVLNEFDSKTNQIQFAEESSTSRISLLKRIEAQALVSPESIALATNTEKVTYRELYKRSNQLAHHLQSLGVGPNTLVGLILNRSPSLVIGALGILKAGGAYLPLDPHYPFDRLAWILQDANPPVLVTNEQMVKRLPQGSREIVSLESLKVREDSFSRETPSTLLSQLAYTIYTSGSTGHPKGVQITHESLLNLITWHQQSFEITPKDRATQYASPGFDAVVWEIWPYLTAGASLHFVEETIRVYPESLRDWMVGEKITISFLPTPIAERMIQLSWPKDTSLRLLLTGADVLKHYPPPGLPFKLINNYGPTESTVVATSGVVSTYSSQTSFPSIGKPIANTEVYILDENSQPSPQGIPGELFIGGAGLARGYLNQPELTAEKFISHPFSQEPNARLYRTGDIGRFLPDGQIEFIGRTDEQIKIDGYRIEPEEIVSALNAHPYVQSSIVIAREDSPGIKCLVAYLITKEGAELRSSDLLKVLRKTLPEYMLPSTFVHLESFPLTTHGKIDRSALPIPDTTNLVSDEKIQRPLSDIEIRIIEILSKILSLDTLSIHDNFFLLGGHSLLGTQLISRIRETFGVNLHLKSIFDSPTVAEMAIEVERLIHQTSHSQPKIQPRTSYDNSLQTT